MRVSLQQDGALFRIYALVLDNGDCPAIEFMERLKRDAPASHKSLVNRYNRLAQHGPSFDERQSRPIKGYDGLYEFKSRQGDRLLYFYLPRERRAIAVTHGFHKGAPARAEYARAQRLMRAFLDGETHGKQSH